ncbi:hypothetical protein V865_005253 [Kwoniella europaea PYCC6329]|uniref:Uncharacterized protein n=1 Tax=Kwoniella europaea PYCC6329 TaxID=1423913 RepID=A0AAX4KL02_9TREE
MEDATFARKIERYKLGLFGTAVKLRIKRTISTWNARARRANTSLTMSCSRIENPDPLGKLFSALSCCPNNGADELDLTYYSTNFKIMRVGASTEDRKFLEASKEPWETIIARTKSGQTITAQEEAGFSSLFGGSQNI